MSKELAERLESYYALDMIKDGPMKDDLREAIAALRSETEYALIADDCGGPARKLPAPPSRETDQRESSGIRIEGSQSPGSNPAPDVGQSKTGLTESHSGAPTQAEPALSAEQIEVMRVLLIKVGLNPALCDMALSSLTARPYFDDGERVTTYNRGVNEGIEAAAKAAHESLRDIDRAHAEIAYSAASKLKGASHD